jgi:hypothetical protein
MYKVVRRKKNNQGWESKLRRIQQNVNNRCHLGTK